MQLPYDLLKFELQIEQAVVVSHRIQPVIEQVRQTAVEPVPYTKSGAKHLQVLLEKLKPVPQVAQVVAFAH